VNTNNVLTKSKSVRAVDVTESLGVWEADNFNCCCIEVLVSVITVMMWPF
jgi:hypothetical protein